MLITICGITMTGFTLSELICDVWSGELACNALQRLLDDQLPRIVTFWYNHHEESYERKVLHHILQHTSPVLEELAIIASEASEDTCELMHGLHSGTALI